MVVYIFNVSLKHFTIKITCYLTYFFSKLEKLNQFFLKYHFVSILKQLRRAFIWIITTSMMMSALFLCYWMFQPEVPYLWFYSSFYIAVHRLAWAIGVAWIILDSTFHKNGIFFYYFCFLTLASYTTFLTTQLLHNFFSFFSCFQEVRKK